MGHDRHIGVDRARGERDGVVAVVGDRHRGLACIADLVRGCVSRSVSESGNSERVTGGQQLELMDADDRTIPKVDELLQIGY